MTEQEKAEIIAEMKREMLFGRENPKALQPTVNKWCNTPDYYTSKMREAFDGDGIAEGVAWDCIRKLTCKIMRVSYVRQIKDVEKANAVADELCSVVSRLAKEAKGQEKSE